jgi:hypothetical protein
MYKFIYLSIDPGTHMLGTTINAITEDNRWVVLCTHTTNIKNLIKHVYSAEVINAFGERFCKSKMCGEVINKFATSWQVNKIVSESPYMGKFPAAFSALTECMLSMRYGAYNYNTTDTIVEIDPATIKKAVGVPGNSGDKELMRLAVSKLVGGYIDVSLLDEHSIDSIAVGYAWYRAVWLGY